MESMVAVRAKALLLLGVAFLVCMGSISCTKLKHYSRDRTESDAGQHHMTRAERLAFEARGLTTFEAEDLEARVSANPYDLDSRTRLLGYYKLKALNSKDSREAYEAHVLWIIEHRPDADIAGTPYVELDPVLNGEAFDRGMQLWLQTLEAHPKDTRIIGNAANYFTVHETALAEDLLRIAQSLEPKNREWTERLEHLQALIGRPQSSNRGEGQAARTLMHLEIAMRSTRDRDERFHLLEDVTRAAFRAGDMKKAEGYAKELLDEAEGHKDNWDYGNAVHYGNLVLGFIALRSGDIKRAGQLLLEAGRTPGSPKLRALGPDMTLAEEMLKVGERRVALDYLLSCKRFYRDERLDRWISEVRAGELPNFGDSAGYRWEVQSSISDEVFA